MRVHPTLESKFIVLVSLLILVGSIVANSWIGNVYRDQLISDAEQRALLLTESTAISFTNTLLYEELDLVEEGGLLENFIQDVVADSSSAVKAVTVYDKDGIVIASDDYNRYFETPDPKQLVGWAVLSEPRYIRPADRKSFEIVSPLQISTKRFGTLCMQFTLVGENMKLADFKNGMLLIIIGIAIIGILIAFFVARTLARPIKRLAGEMHKVHDPEHVVILDSKRKDEIGELESGFVDMLQRLKAAADEKERQQQALVQTEKLASLGTLVSGLAHEINNPLAGLRNCLRRITTQPEKAEQTRKYAGLMDSALVRIEKIVKDLLNFSRRKELILRRTDLNMIINTASVLVNYRVKAQKLELQLNLAHDLPAILGEPQHLEQVFVNLLLNAVDATPEDGYITVKTSRKNNTVIGEVSNTGRGISSEIKDKIFDPFFTTKPVGKGTGLGLAVTKAIVEEHHGSIDFVSDGSGTSFRLSFPKAVGNSVRGSKLSAAILAGGESKRMGHNKALLRIRGKTIIQRVAEMLLTQVPEVMIISNKAEQYAFLGLPVRQDEVERCGPLGGIYTALLHSKHKHCLVVACDLPFLSTPILQFLAENCAPHDVLAFESESGVEPLCAVYSKSCLSAMQEQIKAGQYKVSDFYDKASTRLVQINPGLAFYDKDAFLNINTPDDLEQARQVLKETSMKVATNVE